MVADLEVGAAGLLDGRCLDAIGLGELVTFSGGGPVDKWLHLGTGVLLTMLGVLCLASAVALRRRQRRLSAPASGSGETPGL